MSSSTLRKFALCLRSAPNKAALPAGVLPEIDADLKGRHHFCGFLYRSVFPEIRVISPRHRSSVYSSNVEDSSARPVSFQAKSKMQHPGEFHIRNIKRIAQDTPDYFVVI
jgi:hypothetical protein